MSTEGEREYILKEFIPARDRFEASIIKRSRGSDSQNQNIRTIGGIIDGIMADKIIKPDELNYLFKYLSKYKDSWPKCQLAKVFVRNVSCFSPRNTKEIGLRDIARTVKELKNKLYQNEELIGLIKGFLSDGELNKAEVSFFKKWAAKQENIWPIPEIQEAINDSETLSGTTNNKFSELAALLYGLVDKIKPTETNTNDNASFISNPPQETFSFLDKPFELSGCFEIGPKEYVGKEIVMRGGIVSGWYSEGYLVVGKYADPRWIHGIYGRKVEYALENKIPIISEAYLVEAFKRFPKLPPKASSPKTSNSLKKKETEYEPLQPHQWRDLVKRAESLRGSKQISDEVCNEILGMLARLSGLNDISHTKVDDIKACINTSNGGGVSFSVALDLDDLEKKRKEWQIFFNPQSSTNPQ